MKKLLIIIGSIILVGLIGYLVLPQDEVSRITIVIMENDLDSNYIENVINDITDISYKSNEDLDAKIILPKGIIQKFKIESPVDFQEEKDYKLNQKSKLFKALFQKVSLTNEEANLQIESLLNTLNFDTNENEHIFIIGSFPNCYNSKDLAKIKLDYFFKSKINENINIIWSLKTSIDEPEEKLFRDIKKKGINISKSIQSSTKRICNDINKPQYYLVALSTISENEIGETTKILKNNIEKNSAINLLSLDGNKPAFDSNDSVEVKLIKFLQNAKGNTFLEARNLMMQQLNNCLDMKDSNAKVIIFIGNVAKPTQGEIQRLQIEKGKSGIITTKEQLIQLQKVKNIEFLLALKSGKKDFNFQNEILKTFIKYKIKIKVIN